MNRMSEVLLTLGYTIEKHEIHAWKLAVKDSRSIYYSTDYEKPLDMDNDILMHLLQYGINQVVLIHEDINERLQYYIIDSIFNTEEDYNGVEYFTLHRISESDANN